jgi:hypothetical protein
MPTLRHCDERAVSLRSKHPPALDDDDVQLHASLLLHQYESAARPYASHA